MGFIFSFKHNIHGVEGGLKVEEGMGADQARIH